MIRQVTFNETVKIRMLHKRRIYMEDDGNGYEEIGPDEDDLDEKEDDDESDAILREKSDSLLPRDNI